MDLLWVASLRVVAASSSSLQYACSIYIYTILLSVGGVQVRYGSQLYCVIRILPPMLPREAKIPYQYKFNRSNALRYTMIDGCFWHGADKPPLERLLILRCAIQTLEGLQIQNMKVAKMRIQELNLGVGCLEVPARCVT